MEAEHPEPLLQGRLAATTRQASDISTDTAVFMMPVLYKCSCLHSVVQCSCLHGDVGIVQVQLSVGLSPCGNGTALCG